MMVGICASCSKNDESDAIGGPASVTGNTEKHEYVDLGLPSGTLWATCNVGANRPEEYGYYFAWSRTEPNVLEFKEIPGSHYGGYNTDDGKTELMPEDDAATVNWGKEWQTPSLEQWQELISGTYTITSILSEGNWIIKSKKNGKMISLPIAGYAECESEISFKEAGIRGFYWTRTADMKVEYYAYDIIFNPKDILNNSKAIIVYRDSRSAGFPIRPVRKNKI